MVVRLIDGTLREGAQAPGVHFSVEDSIEIAQALNCLGVDTIEVGHAIVSDVETERVKAVVKLGLRADVLTHARANLRDIDAAKKTGASWVGIFVGLNDRSRKVSLNGRSEDQVLDLIKNAVSYAKNLGMNVRYTVEDSSRTSIESLERGYLCAIRSGADRICFSDSVGLLEPKEVSELVYEIRNRIPYTPLEVHLHNDRGLALANALSAIDAGAEWVSCSINGIGERAGITDTISMIASLHYRDRENGGLPEPKSLKKASKLVNALTRSSVLCRQPIVGRNVFVHTAKLHKDAVVKDSTSYAWTNPGKFGEENVVSYRELPRKYLDLVISPEIISAVELKYHRHGPGDRYVMIDDRFLSDCRIYSIVRRIYGVEENSPGHVDSHRHHVDSFFLFLSQSDDMTGLYVEVSLGQEIFQVSSPACVFIPSGVDHSYKVISGEGLFINTVLSGNYNESLMG